MKKHSKPLKRYIYVSSRKIDMFDQQGKRHAFLSWFTSWFTTTTRIKVGGVEIEKPAGVSAVDFSKLTTLLSTLEREYTMGTVDAPAEYIKDTLPLFYRLIPSYPNYSRLKGDPGLIYFGGHTKQTILALVGSPFHLIGRTKESTQGNLATTCLTHTFRICWTNTLSGQPQPDKMLTEEYPRSLSPGALL